ncbi:MAG: hypothetical protein DYG89_32005 [Caldilinea sp. CFX5]|nr:hypothetical protein [Caldilinea sp. CFX5]
MKRKLYTTLVPGYIQEKLYQFYLRQVKEEEIIQSQRAEETLPHPELSSIYIANLRVLIDRHAFLHAMPKDAVVAQIGATQHDDFPSKILSITRPKQLYLLDPKLCEPCQERQLTLLESKFRSDIKLGQVVILPESLPAALERVTADYFDWVYLDLEPTYAQTVQTLAIVHNKIRQDGLITGNNYVTGSWRYRTRYGVIEAVNEFCKNQGWEMIYLTHESHRHLSYALRKIAR